MTDPTLRHAGINLGGTDANADAKAQGAVFGFWIFLMSDAVIFALLFAVYGTAVSATAGGPAPSDVFDMRSALVETVVLLTSSLTMGLATLSMKYEDGRLRVLGWMAVTLALGIVFLAMELHDFRTMFAQGAFPTRSAFLSAFFALVPLHGLHVLVGSVWMVVMACQMGIFGFDAHVKINILRLGLFWHFLDVIWIAIVSCVYLQGLIR